MTVRTAARMDMPRGRLCVIFRTSAYSGKKGCDRMQAKASTFYLGGLSVGGYRGYFDEFVREFHTPVFIEGGFSSGAGKILSAAANAIRSEGRMPQHILCASGAKRPDAVACSELGLCFVNAAAPHAPRAVLPEAVERMLPLYDAYDARALWERRDELAALTESCGAARRRAARYVSAAASLMRESERSVSVCTDLEKARRLALALSRRYLPPQTGAGGEQIRLLSAVTSEGLCFLYDALDKIETLVVLEDEFGEASDRILRTLRDDALAKGHRVITCPCAIRPRRIEHLIFPQMSTAFVTANRYHADFPGNPRRIHCLRFSDKQGIRLRRTRLRFNRKMAQELLSQACSALQEAGEHQAEIDKIYAEAEIPERMENLCRRAKEIVAAASAL